jgi:hypothetical protein
MTLRRQASEDEYNRAAQECLAACAQWRAENPDARLVFHGINTRADVAVIGDLGQALKRCGIAGNSATRKLLTRMYRAVPGGATVMMAEYALEQVYGLSHVLSVRCN